MQKLVRFAVYNRIKDEDGKTADTEHRFLLNKFITSNFALLLHNNIYV